MWIDHVIMRVVRVYSARFMFQTVANHLAITIKTEDLRSSLAIGRIVEKVMLCA